MSGGIGALLAAVAAAVPGIIRFVPVLKEPKVRKIALKIALVLAGLLVPLTAVLLFYALCGIERQHPGSLAWAAGALAVVSIFVININLTGPHRLYRDALARTFIQKTADGTPDVNLADINPRGTAPYHLINAALNVPSSQSSALKDRGCDFFLFSKRWMGSASTGYHRDRNVEGKWRERGPRDGNGGLRCGVFATHGSRFDAHAHGAAHAAECASRLLDQEAARDEQVLARPASPACSARCSASACRKRQSG